MDDLICVEPPENSVLRIQRASSKHFGRVMIRYTYGSERLKASHKYLVPLLHHYKDPRGDVLIHPDLPSLQVSRLQLSFMRPLSVLNLFKASTYELCRPEEILQIFKCITEAVLYLHDNFGYHGGITPGMLFKNNGDVLLYGSQCFLTPGIYMAPTQNLLIKEQEKSTYPYEAPELWDRKMQGINPTDKNLLSLDIFSLGVVFAHLITKDELGPKEKNHLINGTYLLFDSLPTNLQTREMKQWTDVHIPKMCTENPADRPTIHDVIKYF